MRHLEGEWLVRAARMEDIERLLEIHCSAFPDPRGIEARRRNFLENALGGFSDLRVVEDAHGHLAAHAFLFRLEVWFGGRAAAVGGIASVGVAPEARGRGAATHLLGALHAESAARGEGLTLLFPFRQGFYARVGYAPVTAKRRLAFTPRAVPRAWLRPPEGISLRAAEGRDRVAIEAAYLRAAARATGWLTRPARVWDRVFLDERRRWFVAVHGEVVVGFLAWTVSQPEPHARETLVVHELTADDEPARRALVGLIGAQRDQVDEVFLEVDADDPIDRALLDADGARRGRADVEHALGEIVGGPMVRVADAARALAARGWGAPGALTLDIEGARLSLEVEAGAARVAPSSAPHADLVMDRTALAAVAFGALAPSSAARIGWLRARDASTLARADAVFALAPYFAIDLF